VLLTARFPFGSPGAAQVVSRSLLSPAGARPIERYVFASCFRSSSRSAGFVTSSLRPRMAIHSVPSIACDSGAMLPVQWVNRPHLDFRGYAGTVASGMVAGSGTTTGGSPSRMNPQDRPLGMRAREGERCYTTMPAITMVHSVP